MVEVFKTNVAKAEHAQEIVFALQQYFPGSRVTIDLEDCDRVLRVEARVVSIEKIIQLVQSADYECVLMN